MTSDEDVCSLPAGYLAAYFPEMFESLDDAELMSLICDPSTWLRPDQTPGHDDWTYLGFLGGRGGGKSFGALNVLQREVELGNATNIAMVSQSEGNAYQVAVEDLQRIAPPWCKPELFKEQVLWPNGAKATIYSPLAPAQIRGPSFDFAYAAEVNFWSQHTALEAWTNLTTALRVGRARLVWDSSPQDENLIVSMLLDMFSADPRAYPILRTTMCDNPALGRDYVRRQSFALGGPGAQRWEEEIMGRVSKQAQGAAFDRDLLNKTRVPQAPRHDVKIVSVDPATTVDPRSDLTGIVVVARDRAGHVYGLEDHTARLDPTAVCNATIDQHFAGATAVLAEHNRGGVWINHALRAVCTQRGVQLKELAADERIPPWQKGLLFYKALTARVGKMQRALPVAALMRTGKVHLVGSGMTELEASLTTYSGRGESPNAFDAFNQAVCELGNLHGEIVPSASARTQRIERESVIAKDFMAAQRRRAAQRPIL